MARPRHLLLLTVVAFAMAAAPAAACTGASTTPTASNLPAVKATTLCLLNEQRARHGGFGPLTADAALERAATEFSLRMVVQKFFAHLSPDGVSPLDRILQAGARLTGDWFVGENIGYGTSWKSTPGSMVDAWMNSPSHRENILNGDFRSIGIGVVLGTPAGTTHGATYTTDFATGLTQKAATKKKAKKKKKKATKKKAKKKKKKATKKKAKRKKRKSSKKARRR
jgi:uncharacterized protein YkwD